MATYVNWGYCTIHPKEGLLIGQRASAQRMHQELMPQEQLQGVSACHVLVAVHAGKPSKDTGSGSQEQTYVKTVIELHDKYLQVSF